LCSVGIAAVKASYAWLIRPFFDDVLLKQNMVLLVSLSIVVVAATGAKALLTYFQGYLLGYVSNWVIANIREQLFSRMIRLPVRFHDENASGRSLARITSDTVVMGQALPVIVKNVIQESVTFIGLVGVLFAQSWKLTFPLLVVAPISMVVALNIGQRLRRLSKQGLDLTGTLASQVKEAFAGISAVKIHGREEHEDRRFQIVNQRMARTYVKAGQWAAMTSPLIEIVGGIGIGALIVYGGHEVIHGMMTPGALVSFIAALLMSYTPLRRLASANNSFHQLMAGVQRVFEILDMEVEEERNRGGQTLPRISKSLAFERVSFRYADNLPWALRDIDLIVHVGEMIALVGHSGSGKTTLAKLIPRLYEPTAGRILMDRVDIRQGALHSLRGQMGVVSQETMLFDDTIKANIVYGREDATERQIVMAARAANALEFIKSLPEGFDTRIGENGVTLSGGERQRLAIARAILRDPPILILDEATSSLDSESEQSVQEAIANLLRNRTTIVISHRLSTVRGADRIVVLDRGRIVDCAPHAQLWTNCELYRRLSDAQLRDSAEWPAVGKPESHPHF
jgi:subfamily B ATP-binding cassette protein MsbA